VSCEISLLQIAAGISRKVLGVNGLGADMGWRAFEGAEMRGGMRVLGCRKTGNVFRVSEIIVTFAKF
jgi:hypothetical protein